MLLTLPNELLLTISTSLPSDPDLNNLLRTSKRLYHLLNPILYHRNVHHPNTTKDQAIFWAISHNQQATIHHLLDATGTACLHAQKPMTQQSPLAVAAEQGHPGFVEIFLTHGADITAVDVVGQTPLVTVLRAIAELAEQDRLDECVAGNSAIPSPSPGAVRKQDTVSVPDARTIAPRQMAAVDLLIGAYSDTSTSTSTSMSTPTNIQNNTTSNPSTNPLHHAARIGDPTLFHALLTKTPYTNPSVTDNWRRTPLTHAAITGNLAIAQYLLTLTPSTIHTTTTTTPPPNPQTFKSVDPNHRDFRGSTPLMSSIIENHSSVSKYLLSIPSVDPDARDDRGQSCLSWACRAGRDVVIPWLINGTKNGNGGAGTEVNVNVNVQDTFGKTPLLWAIEGGDVHVVRVLLESARGRVDVSLSSSERGERNGMMPVEVARRMGREDIVGVLEEFATLSLSEVDYLGRQCS